MLPNAKLPRLEPFQEATVGEIISRLDKSGGQGLRLALADEVGLGKTHVISAIAATQAKRRTIIFYVAPSLEVAGQNGPKIAEACGKDPEAAKHSLSRLALLPSLISDEKDGPFIISLTPETSFRFHGPGNRLERAFLFQVIHKLRRKLRRNESKLPARVRFGSGVVFDWATVFYRPRGSHSLSRFKVSDPSYEPWKRISRRYSDSAEEVATCLAKSKEFQGRLIAILHQFKKRVPGSQQNAFRETSKLVRMFRLEVARFVLTESHRPDFVFLDEWHKYSRLITSSDGSANESSGLLKEAMERWHQSPGKAPRLTLFISATPFEVDLESIRDVHELDGLSGLCQAMDPSGKTKETVENARRVFQAAWEKYRDALLVEGAPSQRAARKHCLDTANAFSDTLARYIIRTERPGTKLAKDVSTAGEGAWRNADLHSLLKLTTVANNLGSHTDVVALWLSSSHFPSMHDSYKIAEELKKRHGNSTAAINRLSSETHWKRECLVDEIRTRWGNGRKTVIPPLWIPPLESGKDSVPGKLLIFSSWKAVPREVSFFLNDNSKRVWKLGKMMSSTPLGTFPPGEMETYIASKKKQGWRLFYPVLYFKDPERRPFFKWLKAQFRGQEMDRDLASVGSRDWAEIFVSLDFAFAEFLKSENLEKAATARASTLDTIVDRVEDWRDAFMGLSSTQFLQIIREINFGRDLSEHPGAQFMSAADAVMGDAAVQMADVQKNILVAAKHIANYFNREIAQRIIRAECGWGRNHEYSRDIIKYCKRFGWMPMLVQYIKLLNRDYSGWPKPSCYKKVFDDLGEALDTRASVSGRGWWKGHKSEEKHVSTVVQPFMESKAQGPKAGTVTSETELHDGSMAAGSTTRRRKAFNSPFLPHVLVSTSVGQEGIDFHRYCDTVVHWNPPGTPLALEQREGRVDRFHSYQVRRLLSANPQLSQNPDASGLSPNFCVIDQNGDKVNRTERRVWLLPYSREQHEWRRCLERLHYFRLFIGAPDPIALEAELQGKLLPVSVEKRIGVLRALAEIRIELRPRDGRRRFQKFLRQNGMESYVDTEAA